VELRATVWTVNCGLPTAQGCCTECMKHHYDVTIRNLDKLLYWVHETPL